MGILFCENLPDKCPSCWADVSVFSCYFNTAVLLIFVLYLVYLILFSIINGIFKTQFDYGFPRPFTQSIFSCLAPPQNSFRQKVSFYLLSLSLTFGILLFRPIGYMINVAIIFAKEKDLTSLLIIVSSLTEAFYFFNVMFGVNFFGIKTEILHLKGHPAVSAKERGWFLKMVLKRSLIFAFIYFCGGLLRLVSDRKNYTYFDRRTSSFYDWLLRAIQYACLAILTIRRLSYIRYAKKMVLAKTNKKNLYDPATLFTQHVEGYSLPRDQVLPLIHNIQQQDTNQNKFLKDFEAEIDKKCQLSDFILDEKVKFDQDSKRFYQPLITNTKENYVIAAIFLIFTTVDAIVNIVLSSIGIVIFSAESHTESNPIIHILLFVILALYALETIFQSLLSAVIINNKENFGEQKGSEHSENESQSNSGTDFQLRFSSRVQSSQNSSSQRSVANLEVQGLPDEPLLNNKS